MLLAQETLIKEGSKFANQHGITALLLVCVLCFGAWFAWKIFSFIKPLTENWVDVSIKTCERNTKALERHADALELIGAAVTASEKTNELVIAKIDGVNVNVKKIEKELVEVKQEIKGIQHRLDK